MMSFSINSLKTPAVIACTIWGLIASPAIVAYGQEPVPVAPPAVYPSDTWEGKDHVVIRVLDRIRSLVRTVILKKNEPQKIGSIDITLRRCLRRAPTLPTDDAAWLEIRDDKIKTSSFDGWMVRSMPQIGIFENPVYDVRLIRCEGEDTDPLLPKLEPSKAPLPLPRAATKNSSDLDNLHIQPQNHNDTIVQQPLASPTSLPLGGDDKQTPQNQSKK